MVMNVHIYEISHILNWSVCLVNTNTSDFNCYGLTPVDRSAAHNHSFFSLGTIGEKIGKVNVREFMG